MPVHLRWCGMTVAACVPGLVMTQNPWPVPWAARLDVSALLTGHFWWMVHVWVGSPAHQKVVSTVPVSQFSELNLLCFTLMWAMYSKNKYRYSIECHASELEGRAGFWNITWWFICFHAEVACLMACMNGGRCLAQDGVEGCVCPEGFRGRVCEEKIGMYATS